MMKSLLTVLVAASLTIISAHAKTMKVPSDEFAIASISIPDDWDVDEEVNNGVGASSDDGAVYLSCVAVGSDKGMNAELDSTFDMLKEHGVTLDDKSKKEQDFKINGMDAHEMIFQGKDEDGPASVSICFVPMSDKMLVLTYWVSSEKEKEHDAEVSKIVSSIKATK
ncbi:MAG: histidine kinase [Chthoniobacterales bacterium]